MIHKTAQALSPGFPEEALKSIADSLQKLLDVNYCLIFGLQLSYATNHYSISSSGNSVVEPKHLVSLEILLQLGSTLCQQYQDTLSAGNLVAIAQPNFPTTIQELAKRSNIVTVLISPLQCRQHYLGSLLLYQCERPRIWTTNELNLVSAIAEHCVLILRQAERYQQAQAQINTHQQAHNELENQIAKRTTELQDVNKQLKVKIAEHQQVEEALRRTNSLLKAQQEAAIDGILVVDETRQIVSYNHQFCRLWHIPDEVMQSHDDQRLLHHMVSILEEPQEFLARVEQLYQQPSQRSRDEIYLTDGRVLDRYSGPVLSPEGYSYGRIWYFRDITQHKWAEQEVRNALQKEKELNELRTRFVSMVSHEFRTPLSTILSSSELLEHYRHYWTEVKKLRHLHRIQAAVHQISELLDDILVIGKEQAGEMEFNPVPLELPAFCQDIVEEVQLNAGNGPAIYFNFQGSFTNVCMDEKLLWHILTNLLSNAIKYSPQSDRVQFNLTCNQQFVTFCIQDQGIGIPLADQRRLFSAFHRGSNVGTTPGTGLGLAIVKRCVDLHNGDITVVTREGTGTTFTVTIPWSDSGATTG